VSQMTVDELKTLDAAARFDHSDFEARIPTLEEVLSWARGRTRVVIELKGTQNPQLVRSTLACVEKLDMVRDVMLIAFDHFALREAREASPTILTGALYVGRPVDPVSLATACGADALCPHWASISAADVAAAHRTGLAVCVWTVNEPSEIESVTRLGVDGVTSDTPERVVASAEKDRSTLRLPG